MVNLSIMNLKVVKEKEIEKERFGDEVFNNQL